MSILKIFNYSPVPLWIAPRSDNVGNFLVFSDLLTLEMQSAMNAVMCDAATEVNVRFERLLRVFILLDDQCSLATIVDRDMRLDGGHLIGLARFDPINPFSPDWI